MNEVFGKMFILNGELQPADLFDNSCVYEGESVYEVIRMIKGTPLFFDDHLVRLQKSLTIKRRNNLADAAELRRDIINLTRADKKKESNLKIVFNYNGKNKNYLVYYLEPVYPSSEQYLKGVKATLFQAQRKDPESKVIDHRLRSAISQKLLQESAYEAILVNVEGQITEGSRSNIFFLKGDTLTTAPDKMILSGITRKHILDICNENGITVIQGCVSARDLGLYNAVFMTGTSPMVLPFNCIDSVPFSVSFPLMEHLRKLYLVKAEESIKRFRQEY
jgi:branched-chain amino acid aminotransferase